MRRDLRVPERVHKLKLNLEEILQLKLARSQRELAAAEAQLRRTQEQYRRAQAARNQAQTGADWWLWQSYVEALDRSYQATAGRVAQLQQAVTDGRTHLQAAHREQLRWDVMVRQVRRRVARDMARRQQRESDEIALLRYGRRMDG
jgi:flagellar export protein FliJ